MVSLGPNRINCHVLGLDRGLYWKYKDPNNDRNWAPGMQAYHNKGGKWIFDPISCSRAVNFLSAFTVGDDHALYQANFDLVNVGDFTPWTKLGGHLSASPAVINRGGTLHMFHVGMDHGLYHKSWDGRVYRPPGQGWEKVGGNCRFVPAAVATGPNELDVFALGATDKAMRHFHQSSNGAWVQMENLPGEWGAPKAVSKQPGHWDVFGSEPSGRINHVSFANGRQTGLESLPGTWHALDAISWGNGRIDILALDARGGMFHRASQNGNWQGWENIGGVSIQAPKAVCHSVGALAVFTIGTDQAMFVNFRNPKTGKWGGWFSLGGKCIARVG